MTQAAAKILNIAYEDANDSPIIVGNARHPQIMVKAKASQSDHNEEPLISVMDFNDYRHFLKAWYKVKKKSRFGYSYQKFSNKAGFSSPNFLKQVIDGHRNLSEESIHKFLKVLDLSEGETRYFKTLVFFNQALTESDKEPLKKELINIKKTYLPAILSQKHSKILNLWYSFAVRELVMHPKFDGNPAWIAKKMSGRITADQVASALNLLEDTGLIQKQEDGRYLQTHPVTLLPGSLSPKEVANYHRNMLTITSDVLMNDRKPFGKNENIDISSLTLGITRSRIPEIRSKIAQFRKDILSLVARDTHPDDVIQLSIQMVPLTKTESSNS